MHAGHKGLWSRYSFIKLFVINLYSFYLCCSLSYHVVFQMLTHLFLKIGIKTNNKIKKRQIKSILYEFGTKLKIWNISS